MPNIFPLLQSVKSIIFPFKILEEHNEKINPGEEKKTDDTDQIVAETVDQSLKAYDENNDGYINYGEFYRYNR